uniref:Uncharacterized protein n=1 Tax=Tanacetum cinerariifolium TaxID=118510 RepID=A0A699I4E6_TANCI|nr:hypothetical protein [Tanacetum cinerariifolium]
MACSLPHNIDEIKAMVQKQIEKDKVHQLAIMNLAVEYDNACTTKDELQNAYEKCTDIPQEKASYQYLSNIIYFHTNTMANEPNEVRDAILRRLRTGQEKEVTLANSLLGEMTRYLLQMHTRAERKRGCFRCLSTSHLTYGLHTLHLSSESDTRITTALEADRKEVMKSINEKQELINNYRAI